MAKRLKLLTYCFEMAGRVHFFAALYFDPSAALTMR